jgi:lysophospholipid hydrolase
MTPYETMFADAKQFETLGGFKQFSEVLAVGLKSGREVIKQWREEGKLPSGLVDDVKGAQAIQRVNRLR